LPDARAQRGGSGVGFTDGVDGFLLGKRYLLHDRDPLFTDEFRGVLAVPFGQVGERCGHLDVGADCGLRIVSATNRDLAREVNRGTVSGSAASSLSSAWPCHSLGARDRRQHAAEPGDPAAAGGDATARAIAVTALA
jgi:hypothetical protein